MIKKITTITIIEEYPDSSTPKVSPFENSIRYRPWDDSIDIYKSTGDYGYSKHIKELYQLSYAGSPLSTEWWKL